MVKVNPHFKRTEREIIFPVIEKKIEGKNNLVNLGIGDVALPLTHSIADAICQATQEMTKRPIGYGPSAGYSFLRDALAQKHHICADEIFISDGINSDLAGIQELFDISCSIAVVDPGYPVFADTNLIAGRNVTYLPCVASNNFIPQPPNAHVDLIYLCSPGNPTGVAMSRSNLEMWVNYALQENALIVFDAAYASFITSENVPKSIYEIPGARNVAIEMHSFSKSHGFTGLRCAYTIIPEETGLIPLWNKRQNTKYNGCPYPIQKGALAALACPDAPKQVQSYLACAQALKNGLDGTIHGGIDSPYLWWQVPDGTTSWQFFDHLLEQHGIVSIPGSGFGKSGEGFVRLSAFTTMAQVKTCLERLNVYAH